VTSEANIHPNCSTKTHTRVNFICLNATPLFTPLGYRIYIEMTAEKKNGCKRTPSFYCTYTFFKKTTRFGQNNSHLQLTDI